MAKNPNRWKRMRPAEYVAMTDAEIAAHVALAKDQHGVTLTRNDVLARTTGNEVWMNDRYQCAVFYLGTDRNGPLHLSIKRLDQGVTRDWRHLQQIKSEVAGPEREALELFPAESRVIDTSNQYHLWVAPKGNRLEVGWDDGRYVSDYVGKTKAKQRPGALRDTT